MSQSEEKTYYNKSFIDVPFQEDHDWKISYDKKTLWKHGHEMNYIHQIDFSSSNLSYEEDLKTID